MASLSLKHIFKVYDGTVKAVNDFNMEIEDNEFIVFVGPSGCGKSTTLRMIAGLEEITAGELRIDGEVVNDYEPKDRNIAMVFQNYALYPHMSVYENMAFSLRTMHLPQNEIHKKVTEAAEILGITQYLDRKPKALSGGQRQRVALGRAIVRNPKVFLLDEPLSNLDAKLRAAMRAEISRLHKRLNTTFIYVTHDQVEAMTMGTRIVVMKDGFIQQIDTPTNLYDYPDNMFVAGFMGTPQMNFFEGTLSRRGDSVTFSLDCGARIDMPYSAADKIPAGYMDGANKVVFGVRHGGIRLYDPSAADNGEWSHSKAVVSVVEMLGDESLVYASLDLDDPDSEGGTVILKAHPDTRVARGDIVDISITQRKFHVFDAESGHSIKRRIPEENVIPCDIKDRKLCFEGKGIPLPPALVRPDTEGAEAVMPTSALTLGDGEATATVARTEDVDIGTLYTLTAGSLTLFAIEDGKPKYSVGDTVKFTLDFCKLKIDKCGIAPPHLSNSLSGGLIREKQRGGGYKFFFSVCGAKLIPSKEILEKLFMCKGTGIFRTPLELVFDADAVSAEKVSESNIDSTRLFGTVAGIADYGYIRYAEISLDGARVIAPYDGQVSDRVALQIDGQRITVKDKKIDMIIA